MALKLFEFAEQFMIDTFLIKTNPILEKNWINKKINYFAGKSDNF